MLQSVMQKNYFRLPELEEIKKSVPKNKSGEISIADSFIKNTAQSTPIMLGTSIAVSHAAAAREGIPFKKVFKEKTKNVFIPVLLVTSAAVAIFENYITSENNNNSQSEK